MIATILSFAVSAALCGSPSTELDRWLAPGEAILLGEVHGTAEAPQVAIELACRAAARRMPTRLGLEIWREEEPRVARFLATGDLAALTAGGFWRRALPDGRSSAAMLQLVERVADLQQRGLPLQLFLFDAEHADGDRDRQMADVIAADMRAHPDAVTVVLTGNLHARVRAALPRTMGWTLRRAGIRVHAVNLLPGDGSAWSCSQAGRCGPTALHGEAAPAGTFRRLHHSELDATFTLGTVSASPPAVAAADAPAAQLPAIDLRRLDGKPFALATLGRPRIVVLPWSTLCGGRHEEVLARAAMLARRYRRSVETAVLIVNFDPLQAPGDGAELMRLARAHAPGVAVVNETKLALTLRLDAAERARRGLPSAGGASLTLPDLAIVDRNGDVHEIVDVDGSASDAQLVQAVEAALARAR